MNRIKMNEIIKTFGVFLAVAILAIGLVLPQPASAALPAPNFMPGFPMLAGPQVIIMWSPIPGAVKYNVYMNGQKVTESIAMQYIAPAPAEGGNYVFQVTSVDAAGAESPMSQEGVIQVVVLKSPSNLAALPREDRITIRWVEAPGALIYDVFRKVKGEGDYQMISSVGTSRYDDATAEPGKTYVYAVKSKDSSGKASDFSDSVEAQILVMEETVGEAGEAKKKLTKLMLPARQVTQIFMEGAGFDMELRGKEAWVSAHKLYYFPDVSNPATMETYSQILPSEINLRGVTWCDESFFAMQRKPLRVIEINLVNQTIVNQFTVAAPQPGTLVYGENLEYLKEAAPTPYDILCDLEGNLLISDPVNFRVVRYTLDGEYIETLGLDPDAEKVPEPPWKVDNPSYLTMDRDTGELLISSIFTIEKFSGSGERLPATGTLGSNIGQFSTLYGVYLTPKGKLFAADVRAGNIQVFQKNDEGQWEFYWIITDEQKKGNVPVASPSKIVVSDDEKYLFVLEGIAKRIGVFELLWDKADQRPPKEAAN